MIRKLFGLDTVGRKFDDKPKRRKSLIKVTYDRKISYVCDDVREV